MSLDAVTWVVVVAGILTVFLGREAAALVYADDERFTLSTYIRRFQSRLGLWSRAAFVALVVALAIWLIGHLGFWLW